MVRIVKSADLSNVGAVNIGRTTLFCSLFLPSDPKVLVLSERYSMDRKFDIEMGISRYLTMRRKR